MCIGCGIIQIQTSFELKTRLKDGIESNDLQGSRILIDVQTMLIGNGDLTTLGKVVRELDGIGPSGESIE